MKNLRFLPVFWAFACLFSACKGTDSTLLSKIKAELEALEEGLPDADANIKTLADLQTLLAAAPEDLKNDAELGPGFAELNDKIGSLSMRYNAMHSEYEDLSRKLATLVEDYAAGKIQTDAVKTEFETISGGLRDARDGLTKAAESFDMLSADYAKMMSAWNAKKEL